eukprot:9951092-Ditylum_brightwellii.AAC.1
MIKFINEKFIKIAGGLEGTIDNLIIDENYVVDSTDMPIDMVVNLAEDKDNTFAAGAAATAHWPKLGGHMGTDH